MWGIHLTRGLGSLQPGTVPEKIRDFVSANMAWMLSQAAGLEIEVLFPW